MIHEFLAANRTKRLIIHCVGDAMVDQYYETQVKKISAEHPMPIMLTEKNNPIKKPGGVANVAHQLKNFNSEIYLISFIDPLGKEVFESHYINTEGCFEIQEFGCNIPVKNRFTQDGIQIIRWDVETEKYGLGNKLIDFIQQEDKTLAKPDVVIFSDYNKGFFVDPRKWLKKYENIITIVDPKVAPLENWKGCTVFKPNADEAYKLSGLKDPKKQCKFFHDQLNCAGVVITQSGKGVVGSWGGIYFEHRPDKEIQVESVVGAGDTFIAILAMALGYNIPLPKAAKIAFDAGRIYVQQRFNRPIVPAELSSDKIVDAQDLIKRDFKLAFTNGCWDILHSGHISTLKFAKNKADKLVVAINDDYSISRLKGKNRPINPLQQRMEMLAALEMVDFVIPFSQDTPLEVIQQCKPDVLVKGEDYEIDEIAGADIVPIVCRAPILPELSTTKILTKLRKEK